MTDNNEKDDSVILIDEYLKANTSITTQDMLSWLKHTFLFNHKSIYIITGLKGNHIRRESERVLRSGFKANGLTTVHMWGIFISNIKNHSSWQRLSWTDNVIGFEEASVITETLQNNTTVTTLNLWSEFNRNEKNMDFCHVFLFIDNKIGADCSRILSEIFKSNTTITHLDLRCIAPMMWNMYTLWYQIIKPK